MKVAFVNASRSFGGVKAWTLDLAVRLREAGHGVLVCGRPGPFLDRAAAAGLDARATPFGCDFNPAAIWRFERLFLSEGVDVVVCNVGKDLRTAGLAARLAGIPVVHRVGLPRDMRDALKVRLTRRLVRPLILAPCDAVAFGLTEVLPFLREGEVTVILTGKEPAAQPRDRANTPRRLVVSSQLNQDKGHADLLGALAALKQSGRSFVLDVLGTGRAERGLRDLAARLGLEQEVVWHGFQADVLTFLDRADIFVLPSLSEGLPNALLEGMARGLLPVARNVGGVAEVWPPELPRLLVDPAPGLEGLAKALDEALALDDQALLAARRAVHAHAAASFHIEAQAGKIEAWLAGVVERHARP